MAAAKKTKAENTEIIKDPWQEKVTVMIPRLPGKEQPDVNLTVNGRSFQIQRGKAVNVPLPVAEVLELKSYLSAAAEDYLFSKTNE